MAAGLGLGSFSLAQLVALMKKRSPVVRRSPRPGLLRYGKIKKKPFVSPKSARHYTASSERKKVSKSQEEPRSFGTIRSASNPIKKSINKSQVQGKLSSQSRILGGGRFDYSAGSYR